MNNIDLKTAMDCKCDYCGKKLIDHTEKDEECWTKAAIIERMLAIVTKRLNY